MNTKSIHDVRYARTVRLLKATRKKLGLTQVEVARMLGWPRTKISKIETRERRADLLETYALCRLYGLALADLEPLLGQR